MTPRNRTALVEVMARASNPAAWYWAEQTDSAMRLNAASLRSQAMRVADRILPALENAGCVVVPREATEEMLENVNSDVCDIDEAECVYDGNYIHDSLGRET